MNTSNCYQKHLSLSKRILIEKSLDEGKNFKEIAELIGKSDRTISYEIRKHKRVSYGLKFNQNRPTCTKTQRPPYVCNSCPSRKGCRKDRYMYDAETAHMRYKENLKDSRAGIDLTNDEFKRLNRIVTEDIKKGHSFYMIVNNHKGEFNLSSRALYNYVELGYLDIINLDLPRKVRYKKRKKHDKHISRETVHRIGRTYQDFLKFIELNQHLEIVEMDTVEGVKGASVLLTLLFRTSNLLLAFKMDNKDSDNVTKVFDNIKKYLGNELFHRYFSIILTDNGSEFAKPGFIEDNGDDVRRSNLFYCDARASQQKGSLEVTHEYIRRFIPKGESFDSYSQEDITLMINHINNTPRKIFKGQTPHDLKTDFIDDKFINVFKLIKIDSKDVILNKKLFKKEKR